MGLVVPTLLHSFFAEVAHSISSVLRKKGYGLVISSSEEDAELETQEIDQLLARSVDCLFIASAQWTVEGFRRIEERKTPYVLIDRKFVGLAANFVWFRRQAAWQHANRASDGKWLRRIAIWRPSRQCGWPL